MPFIETTMTMCEYFKYLKEHKIRTLGSGAYGVVFQHPRMKNVVVKVCGAGEAYDLWMKYAMNNQDNPYVPQIYCVLSFKAPRVALRLRVRDDQRADRDKYHVVFMEKLVSIECSRRKFLLRKTLDRHGINIPVNVAAFLFDAFSDVSREAQMRWKPNVSAELKGWLKRDKHFAAARRQIKQLCYRGYTGDTHDGNVMIRKTGKDVHLVITDPIS